MLHAYVKTQKIIKEASANGISTKARKGFAKHSEQYHFWMNSFVKMFQVQSLYW